MSDSPNGWEQRLAELKRGFDGAFALPPAELPQDLTQFAIIKAGAHRYAIRMSALAGLEAKRKLVPLPVSLPGLLGLGAVRGQLVPVFDLAALLGDDGKGTPPQWIVTYRAAELIGFAFDDFKGMRRVPARDVHGLETSVDAKSLSRQAIQDESGLVHVLDLESIVASLSFRQTEADRTVN